MLPRRELNGFSFFNMEDKYAYKKPEEKDLPTIDVPLPSGNVILMARPSKYSLIFNLSGMPSAMTEKAVESWSEQGVGNEAEVEEAVKNTSSEDRLRLFKQTLQIRDKVLELSRKPKLVVGPAMNEGEQSTDDVADEDLDYLFKWVASGGVAPNIATFPRRSEQGALAVAGGKKRRDKAVAAGGAE